MGLWTATGLALSWVVASSRSSPRCRRCSGPPPAATVAVRTRLYDRLAAALPAFTWRCRWALVAGALALAAAGLVALVGVPGRLAPMRVGVDVLDYVDAVAAHPPGHASASASTSAGSTWRGSG